MNLQVCNLLNFCRRQVKNDEIHTTIFCKIFLTIFLAEIFSCFSDAITKQRTEKIA